MKVILIQFYNIFSSVYLKKDNFGFIYLFGEKIPKWNFASAECKYKLLYFLFVFAGFFFAAVVLHNISAELSN